MTSNNQRIPDISEWFINLSLDDRVLCLTIVDDFFANSVARMQSKINKNGQGLFKFQQRVVKESKGVMMPEQQAGAYFQQEFVFHSIKAVLKTRKDQLVL